ncbi:MAG: hypothetical protein K9G38_05505 [Bacteroidales bacterium]|nr:hypothetical protein [Bacteroidales bacterium]
MKNRFAKSRVIGSVVIAVVLAATSLIFQSCEQHTITYPEAGYESFSTSVQPIFTKDCAGCHGGSLAPNLSEGSAYISLTTNDYINTADPEASLLYTKLQGSHSSYTSSGNKEMILEWIKAGAPND